MLLLMLLHGGVGLLNILIPIIVVGVLIWLVQAYIPMAEPFKKILIAVAVIVTVLWLLDAFGLFHTVSRIHS